MLIECLTIAGGGDRARSREVKLDHGIMSNTDISGDRIASVRLFNESKGIAIRATHRHMCATRMKKPQTFICDGEIVLQWAPATGTATHHHLNTPTQL